MKKFFVIIALIGLSITPLHVYAQASNEPLNISIYLDLSDRIINGKGESQMLRDTAIISYIIDCYVNDVVRRKIVPCNDKFQIFFYPTDGINNPSQLSQDLTLHLKDYTTAPGEKKKKLVSMKKDMLSRIVPIYEQTIQNKQWLGSDIWGFFQKRVKTLCVEEGYRNILIVLTDGYIYHKVSKLQKGTEYTYLLSSNIDQPNMKLMSCNSGLQDLEVLFLEINPTQFAHYAKIQNIIGTWLQGMGVSNYQIEETDVTANIKPVIRKFLNKKQGF